MNKNNIFALLSTLKEKEVRLQLVDNNLKIDAPKGVLTPELITRLKENKQEIIQFLQQDTPAQVQYVAIEPAEKRDYYILAPAQKRLYFIYRMDKESTAYNMPMSIPMPPDFDLQHHRQEFENAVQQLICRHESLRTSFIEIAGEPTQRVHEWEALSFQIDYFTLATAPHSTSPFFRAFDLSHAPLIRVGVITLPGNQFYFLVNLHHIITDGTSVALLFNDFKALYQGSVLPPLRLQYRDYAQWQHQWRGTPAFLQQQTYWLEHFSGDIPVLNLPTDFPRPIVRNDDGNHIHFQLKQTTTDSLNRYALSQGATPYMILLAVGYIWLSKLSGEEDIVIGSPTAGRPHHEWRDIIGMFVNTLALRHYPVPAKTFADFLKEVKELTLAAFQNQDYPLEDLVERCVKERDTSRNPLFDVMLVFQNMEPPRLHIPGLALSESDLENKTAKFDLNLEAMEEQGQLVFSLEYRTTLFTEQTARRLGHYYINIIQTILENPESRLADIAIITAPEKQRILELANGICDPIPDETLHHLFEQLAETHATQIALVLGDSALTYGQLHQQANQLAYVLRSHGIGPDCIVGLMLERSFQIVIAMLAVLKAGAAYLPIDPHYPEQRKQFMIADSGAKILLTQQFIQENTPTTSITTPITPITSTHLAYVIYTSGSTGKPKGVMLEHRNLVNLILFQHHHTRIDFSKVLQFTTISFDVSFQEIFSTLLAAGVLVLIDEETRNTISHLFRVITNNAVKTLFLPVSFLNVIFNDPDYIASFPPGVTHIITAGEQLVVSPSLGNYLKDHHIHLHNHYGPAETHVVTTLTLDPSAPMPQFPAIGKPIMNTRIYILDHEKHVQPIGVTGELYAAGHPVGRGYLGHPTETDAKFSADLFYPQDRMYRTGDLARRLENGNIEFLGRVDQQVKIRGIRVEPGEIETQLKGIPFIKEAVVVVKISQHGEKTLCAYIVSHSDPEADLTQLPQLLAIHLPPHMIPTYFIPLQSIPLTPSRKVDFKALPEPEISTSSHYTAPRTPLEQTLVKIWAEILGISAATIGIDHNFFHLGGHSLKAIVLISKIHQALEVKISLVEIFKRPFIRALAEYITSLGKDRYHPLDVAEQKEYYPLSAAQKRLYILHRLEPESTVYNMPAVFELHGPVDNQRMAATFNALLQRHHSLRTSFFMIGDLPVQRIHPVEELSFHIEQVDLNQHNVNSMPIAETIKKFIRPFQLAIAPLFRVATVKTTHMSLFMLDMHHIITDGVSSGLLIHDFHALYEGHPLAPLRIQYQDYAQWRYTPAILNAQKDQAAYWLNRFTGEIPLLDLPLDFPRPTTPSFAGESLTFTVAASPLSRLKELASAEGSSLFMILLALFNLLLAKLSGQEDIIIGTPSAGRRHADLAPIIGMFVNTLALRNHPADCKTCREFLLEIKKSTLEAFENQDYPFEELVDHLHSERTPGRNPLFDVMFALQNMEVAPVALSGLEIKPYPMLAPTAMFDLAFTAVESNQEILFSVEYRLDLFTQPSIRRIVSYFLQAIDSLLTDPNQHIQALDILPALEKKQILLDFNQTRADYPQDHSIVQLFQQQVERAPHRVALIGPSLSNPDNQSVTLTYHELAHKSQHLAHLLSQKGARAGSIIGIKTQRSLEMMIGILAIWQSGAAYLPLDPGFPPQRLSYMLRDAGVNILLSSHHPSAQELEFTGATIHLEQKTPLEPVLSPPLAPIHAPAYIIYTSGTTGQPKGVLVDSAALLNRMYWVVNRYQLHERDVILQTAAFVFDVSLCELTRWIPVGATLCFLPPGTEMDPAQIINTIGKFHVTTADFVPSMVTLILDHARVQNLWHHLSSLRWVFTGVEAVGLHLVNTFNQTLFSLFQTRLINAYGPTEATVDITALDCSSLDVKNRGFVPIGTPIANIQIYILDRHNRPQPIHVAGELGIAGHGLARGYLNNPQLTHHKFQYVPHLSSRIYHTGDLARWCPDGNIQFLGRGDHQVKIRGYRIELGEIEATLLEHPQVVEAAVIDLDSPDGSKYLCAYWVPTNPAPSVSQLKEWLASHLAPYMIPAYFVQMAALPRTSAGKVHRKGLPAPDLSNMALDSIYSEPQDPMEKLIATVWKEVLGIPRVGTHDNFFDLGGNSLKIIRVNFRLNESLGLKIPVVQLFKYPTIQLLKEYVRGLSQPSAPVIQPEMPSIPKNPDIAVIGMAGSFPGAADIHEFWGNLKNGIHSISFFSHHELAESGISPDQFLSPNYVRAAGILSDKDRFDAGFFNYTPAEALVMDPQMRLFHECVWQTLEDAAYDPDQYELPIGLYAGASDSLDWKIALHLSPPEHVMGAFELDQLTDSRFIPARISYKLNLKGPAVYIHTACSTSLVAIHTAYHALLAGECTMALAGGVSISAQKKSGYLYQEGMVMSPDGFCRAFDAMAAGTVGGEGVAVVLLKPLEKAQADGDHIYALLKASAMNNDGARRVGFSAPSVDGQAEAISRAYQCAGMLPESIGYIETHGTATSLGDPIEIEALNQAFHTHKKGFCALGSVKSNIGHLDCAAGVAGFIKTVLALTHRQIPPTLHFQSPNPQIDLINSPFYINTALIPWAPDSLPRRAGVSSFGIGGTNVHLILEEPPTEPAPQANHQPRLLILSAKTPTALEKMKENLHHFLTENPSLNIRDIAYTLQIGRRLFPYRWMAICSTLTEALTALTAPTTQHFEKATHPELYSWPAESRRLSLPPYPFEGGRYWLTSRPQQATDFHPQAPLSPARRTNPADWFYIPRWTPITPILLITPITPITPIIPTLPQPGLSLLILSHPHPLVSQLIQHLTTHYIVITASPGDTFQQLTSHEFVLDPTQPNHYSQLLTHLTHHHLFPQRILHTWNLTTSPDSLDTTITTPGFYSLLHLANAISQQEFSGEICIDVLSNGIGDVLGNEPLQPAKAAILGPLKVIPQEYPYIRCRSIDIQTPTPGSRQESHLCRSLVQEFLTPINTIDTATDIAYRNNLRWVKSYEPIRPPVAEAPALREHGVYLITGGIGGIGYLLAQYLAKTCQARLILTGRSPLPKDASGTDKQMKLRHLEEAGGQVLYFAADVADKTRMVECLQQAEATFGPINGVIHAAGVTTGKSIPCPTAETGEAECLEQFRPKIQGTAVLAELFQSRTLDFCLFTSSLSPILGGLGFTAYSAANAFMDAFAHLANRNSSSRWLSINWADWDFSGALGQHTTASEFLITPAEGLNTFHHILTLLESPLPQVAISSGDLQARIDRWVKLKSLRDHQENTTTTLQPRPLLDTPYVAPSTPLEHAIAQIWQQQFGYASIGIQDDFFALGGDSLKAISMISRIHKDLQARVELSEFFARPTIQTLADYIRTAEKGNFTAIPPAEQREYYPLSAAQKRLYLIDQMETQSTGYNMPLASLLSGELDLERLQKAFAALIQRHESLRTSFHLKENQPVQHVHDIVSFAIEFPTSLRTTDFIRPFDLSHAPLLRVGVIKQAEQENILLVDMHHIISDGITLQILEREFAALYSQIVLPPLPLQYKDYACWQNSPAQQDAIQKQAAYWLKELTGMPLLNLPIDYVRPLKRSFDGGAVETRLTSDQLAPLLAMARAEGATLFILLLSAYTIFLAKLSGQEDIPVGTPTAGRGHADLEQIIGMFVNTLVLRNYPSAEKTFRQFCLEVKERTLLAFENQDYPFEGLVEKLVSHRDTSRNPLFDTAFVLQSQAQDEPTAQPNNQNPMPGLTIQPQPLEKASSPFDLIFDMVERQDTLCISMQYCSQVFQAETIQRFGAYFKEIITAIIANPDTPISAIDMLPEAEKQLILFDFNNTVTSYPVDKTIPQLFAEQSDRTPDHIALIGEKNGACQLTYAELNHKSSQVARVLIAQGVLPDTIVALMINRSIEMIIGILGILKAGAAYLPIDPDYPEERKQFMLSDSAAKILVTPQFIQESTSVTHVTPTSPIIPVTPISPTNLAYVIYTSGTTGKPKGILTNHRNVIRVVRDTNYIHVLSSDRILQLSNFAFDGSVFDIYGALLNSAVLVTIAKEDVTDAHRLTSIITQQQITVFFLTTALFNTIVDINLPCLATVRKILFGGEQISLSHSRRALSTLGQDRIIHVYGPTETTVYATYYFINTIADRRETIPIGQPIANTTCYILDRFFNPVPLGVPGELFIGGDGVARGYLNNPQLTQDKFQFLATLSTSSSLYRTGDLARWCPDGNIEFLGRLDNQVKIRGFRIEPGEIERQLLNHPDVREAMVMVRKNNADEKYLCAYVVANIDEKALQEYLSQCLPPYMIPPYFIRLSELPLNSSGKVDKLALPEPDPSHTQSFTPSTTPLEEKLASIWSEILALPVEKISRDANFFQIGGHSLKATVLMSKIHHVFHVKVSLGDIFTHPTIAELAALLQESLQEEFQPLAPVEEKEYYPVSSAQKRLYIQQHMIENNTSYNSPLFTLLEGEPDITKLEEVFRQLIARHENLRTSFHLVNEEPVQKVHPVAEIKFSVAIFPPERLTTTLLQPFDLAHAPLLRVELIKEGEQRYILLVDMHHIVTDGFSMNILIHDFITLYAGETLPPLTLQYKDYSQWQNQLIGSQYLKKQERYWLRQFAGDVPELRLPIDFPRHHVVNFDGELIDFSLNADLTQQIRLLASHTGTTLFHILLAVCTIVMAKYSGQEDIVLGTAAAGRNHMDLQGIIGVFVNLLPLRNKPAPHKRFLEFLTEVKDNTIAAYDNQDYPFDELVRHLNIQGTGGRTPLLDVVFNFFNLELSRVEIPGLTLKPYQPKGLKSRFDLVFGANDYGDTLVLGLTYASELFTPATAQAITVHYVQVLEQILENNQITLADIKLTTIVKNAPSRLDLEEAQFDF